MPPRNDLLSGSRINQEEPSDFDRTSGGIPIWSWLSGASARNATMAGENAARRNEGFWNRLGDDLPTRDDLSVEYGGEDYVGGDPSVWATESESDERGRRAQMDALEQMQGWAEGGLTDTDRAMMDETRRGESRNARSDREAALSAMEARGMGGSGMDLMARMGADEAAAGRNSAANTGMLAAAQQRQFDATRAAASMGSALGESDDRRLTGLEAYNDRETAYGRGRENRNTDRENRSRESAADAAQSDYENRERRVAGMTNQYSTDVGRRGRDADREDEANRDLAGLVGGIVSSV